MSKIDANYLVFGVGGVRVFWGLCAADSGANFLWLMMIESAMARSAQPVQTSTESLILAQDERWRRA